MAEETTERAEFADPPGDSAVGSDEAVIGSGEPAGSGRGIAFSRNEKGGLSLQFAFSLPTGPALTEFPRWTHQQLMNFALIAAVAVLAGYLVYDNFYASPSAPAAVPMAEEMAEVATNVRPNVSTVFIEEVAEPVLAADVYIDPEALVIGNVMLGRKVFVGPGATIRADEGTPIFIGSLTNVQDGAVIHALETLRKGKIVLDHMVVVEGQLFAVHIGEQVTIAHGAQIHGPVAIGEKTHVGLNAIVFDARVGAGVVIEPGAVVMGVSIPDGVVVPAGAVITTQAAADALTGIPEDYRYGELVEREVDINEDLGEAYGKAAEMMEAASAP